MITISKKINGLNAYAVTKQVIWTQKNAKEIWKLDWNEETINHPEIIDKLHLFVNENLFNYYPDTNASNLMNTLSNFHKIDKKNILVYSGSDDALDDICRVYLNENDIVIYNHPEYSNFDVFVKSNGARLLAYIDNKPFQKDLLSFKNFIKENNPKIVYLSNPNNPTGYLYKTGYVYDLMKSFPKTLFIIDEAYIHFSNLENKDTIINFTLNQSNLIVTRTFSKLFSLAGLRIGYVISSQKIIQELKLIHKSKNVSMLGQIAANLAIQNYEFYENYANKIISSRTIFISELKKLKFVQEVFESQANFVCVKLRNNPISFINYLESNNVYVRDRNSIQNLQNIFRTTIIPEMNIPIKIMANFKDF
jgi:histidinol-phosphate aminotransferase